MTKQKESSELLTLLPGGRDFPREFERMGKVLDVLRASRIGSPIADLLIPKYEQLGWRANLVEARLEDRDPDEPILFSGVLSLKEITALARDGFGPEIDRWREWQREQGVPIILKDKSSRWPR